MNALLLSDNDKAKMLHALGPLIQRLEQRKSVRIQCFNQSLTLSSILQSLSSLIVRYVFEEKSVGLLRNLNVSLVGKTISNEFEKSRWENIKNEILEDTYWKGTIATLIRVWLLCDHCCRSINAALNIDPISSISEQDEMPTTFELRQAVRNNFSDGLNPYFQDKGFSIQDLNQMLNTLDQLQNYLSNPVI
ncbi:hypothetical protein NAEGRDRAFT_79139 [Naegleria gruberi]|uniref:Uncharacterized protein n=1 Tax=Naegleria gruberi TaxID=5762 RepID=D2V9U7_NAEGR|nr:uncharacterized protein NAEGRDRAFT_79139 [Naegleria gruberi]EFC46202.1 hypothetical protein NAEGRDRAFT_79139 [Naegleria gruberi]|eukprot:XP_002678946.1 hypothetical protein NAEGRDRAFT_79139 [Naegleria gruberi strain NEG-M]